MIACNCPTCRPDLRDRIIGTTECRVHAARVDLVRVARRFEHEIDSVADLVERRAEREDIELGWLDLGESGA